MKCLGCEAKLGKHERGKFCWHCKFDERCRACDEASTTDQPKFLCRPCVDELPDDLRRALQNATPQELPHARRAALASLGVDPEKRFIPAPRASRSAPRADCGHKSYAFKQASILGGDDEVCDECGHVKA